MKAATQHGKRGRFWADVRADATANGGNDRVKTMLGLFALHAGFQLLLAYRCSRYLRQMGPIGGLFGRLVLKAATNLTSCHINPAATIAPGVHLPHATGIVIGEEAVVGAGVTIYQNVTLGQKGDGTGYPRLEQGCFIFAGAQVLGPVTIGRDARVGANAVVLQNVPANSTAVGVPARILA